MGQSVNGVDNDVDLTLASASEVRRRLLTAAGLKIDVMPAHVDEASIRDSLIGEDAAISPEDVAEILARTKVDNVVERANTKFVVGCDQILACDGKFLAKAVDDEGIRKQLLTLRGRTHTLHSAVVLAEYGDVAWVHVDTVTITMRQFTPEFLGRYMARVGDDVRRSVGGYELESIGIQLIERIEGDYFTVLGLPLYALLGELRERGVMQL